MRVTFTIQGQLANLNDYTKACRSNKFAGANLKKKMEDIISLHIRSQLKDVRLREPVYLVFEWFEPNRKRDLDNICFAKKFILDSLVKTEIIKGDSWRYVSGFQDFFFVSKRPRVEVTIWEVEEGEKNEDGIKRSDKTDS